MHRVVVALLFLDACTDADVHEEKSDADTGTADCEFVDPWVFADSADVFAADDATDPVFVMFAGWLGSEVDAECPVVITAESTYTIEGGCVTESGVAWEGRMIVSECDEGDASCETVACEGFSVTSTAESRACDGAWTLILGESGTTLSADVEWAAYGTVFTDLEGIFHTICDVECTDDACTRSGYVRATEQADGRVGDFCFDGAHATYDDQGCSGETDGRTAFSGDGEATLTWEGSESCDGCGEVTIDGRSLGTECP